MKFKVGDKVRVKKNLEIGNTYGCEAFVHDMDKFRGMIVTIHKIFKYSALYSIEEDNHTFSWTEEMFEDYALNENTNIENLQNKIKELKIENSFLSGKLEGYREILKLYEEEK